MTEAPSVPYYKINMHRKDEIVPWLRAECGYRYGIRWEYKAPDMIAFVSFDDRETEMLFLLTWDPEDYVKSTKGGIV